MKFAETIFLTGFPGFIAGRLLEKLAAPERQFYLLVQEAFIEKAMADIESIAARSNTPLENFAVINGDIRQQGLGIEASDLETVLSETTMVFHLAAVYDLAVSKDLANSVNVEGTKNVNAFVKKAPNLRRYNYVSTCYVSGKRSGLIMEPELSHEAGFRNYYEETKYFAEIEVEKLKGEIPLTVLRPSVVCGDSKTGETIKYDGVYYVINYMSIFPELLRLVNIGNENVRLNLVPVDFVVDAIAALAFDPEAEGKTTQLADPNPPTTAGLCDIISRALTGKGSAIKIPASLMERILMFPAVPALSGLPHAGVPYFFTPQTYDTSIASRLLSAHGIECPPFESYVETLIDYAKKHRKL